MKIKFQLQYQWCQCALDSDYCGFLNVATDKMALPAFPEEAQAAVVTPHKENARSMSHYCNFKINLLGKNNQSLLKAYASSYMEKYN